MIAPHDIALWMDWDRQFGTPGQTAIVTEARAIDALKWFDEQPGLLDAWRQRALRDLQHRSAA